MYYMKQLLLPFLLLFALNVSSQEGTKQFMPNSEESERLWLEFYTFDGNDFGTYDCDTNERINIYLRNGEKMHFGMKMQTASNYGGDVLTDDDLVTFRVKDPDGIIVYSESWMRTSGNGYIDTYEQAVKGPNDVILNGTTISGGYDPLIINATKDGNYYIEFETWRYNKWGDRVINPGRRFALQYFDVTVTDGSYNVITNPGEPNKSAGRLWSYGWSFTNTAFSDQYRVNAHFYVFTSDEFINKVNFQMYPYSFAFVVNSYGVTTLTDESNYIKRTQSQEGDQTTDDNITEYKVFLNDPDRTVWPNTTLVPPKAKVWTEDTLFMDYSYNRDPLYLPLDHSRVVMEKNMPSCLYDDIAIFKIEINIDGFTAILIDIDNDGEYSIGGSDRVIYRNMKKGLNYVLWNFKNDAGAEVAEGDYNASATFLGRGPAHFPLYDVEQMDGVTTSSIRPFIKLETTIYWDDTEITLWGDQDGGDLMDETQRKQLVVENDVPRIWSYHEDLADVNYNGNKNTLNTWFNALDLGYSSIGLHVQESATKCVYGLAPWVGDIYMEGPKNIDIEFDTLDFTYKFFDPREYLLSSIQILSLPENGTLKLSTVDVAVNQVISKADLSNLTYTPDGDWFGKDSLQWKAFNGEYWSNNQENIYLIINTPPVISDIPDQTLCTNNQTDSIDFTINDDENDINEIEVTGFSADPTFVPNSNIVISGTGTNRIVTVTPVANKSGMAIIYIMADDGLSQVIEEFTVYVGPDLQFSGDTSICVGDPLFLTAQEPGATSYLWKYEGSVISNLQTVQQAAGSVSIGQWSLTIEKDGCTSTRYFTVSVSPLTTFTGDVDVCVGETLSLSATEVNASYIWRKGTTTVSTSKIYTITTAALTNAATNYSLYVDKDGCTNTSDTFAITVEVLPNNSLTVSGNTVDPEEDGTITVNSAQNDITYNVYNSENILVADSLGAGTNLAINIPHEYLSVGDNIFHVGANNGNCEVDLTDTAKIIVRTPGIIVSTISGNTTEALGTATFTIRLNTEPDSSVTIALSSSDPTEGTVFPASVTFTALNYNTNQTITVTGVNDFIIDGDISYTVNTAAAISTDIKYNGLDAADVDVINTDNDVAGVTVSPASELITTEALATATYTLTLDCEPVSDVTIDISSSDTGEGTISPVQVIFSSANWNTPQTVTITGVNDDIDDDDQSYTIINSNTNSSDTHFDNINVTDVSVTNIDNDDAGITVSPVSGLTTTEAGGTGIFTIVLNTEPAANVTIALSSSDTTEGSVSPSSITFTPENWDIPQTTTVTGVNDDIDDDDRPYTIFTAPATSDDLKYSLVDPANVSITNTDNDISGLTISKSGITTSEAGGAESFTIRLNTQPTTSITIELISSDTGEGTVTTGSFLTFTTANWNTSQTVTITGVDDYIVDSDVPYTISVSINSGDSKYSSALNTSVSASNTDNDVAGVTVSPTSIGTSEALTSAIFSLVLTSQPTSDVTISLTGVDATEGTIDKTSVIFTSVNWNAVQNVTVTGVNDDIADGNIPYTIITTATSLYGLYNGITVDDISVTNADNDVPGITVSPTTLTTSETGNNTFTIALNTQPAADVIITITSLDLTEGTVSPSDITFTNSDWTAKTITVTGVNDAIDDGDITYTIQTSNTASTDGNYNNKPVDDVSVTNTDDDIAGITVSAISGNTTESGTMATFTIVLNSEPAANVIIDLSSGDASEGTVLPASLTFTSANWNIPQSATVAGVNDDIDDGDIEYTIITATASSTDGKYNILNPSDVIVTNTDDDTADFIVFPTSELTTTEVGGTATFTVRLASQPTADVIITLTSGNTAEGTVSPSSLTFTSANWNSAQTVTVTGVNDFVDDGNISYTILTNAASSGDSKYNGLNAADVSVTNTDDDTAGITLSAISGLTTTEAGGTATFTIVLNSRPTTDVVIGFSSGNTAEGTVLPTSVTFIPSSWNTAKTITLTGVDDHIVDGSVPYIVSISINTGDSKYNSSMNTTVSATNTDNDVAGVTVSPTSISTSETLTSAGFGLALTSQPTSDVTIAFTGIDATENTIDKTNVVFTSENWNVVQNVTVTGVNDLVDDGDITYNIITTATSPYSLYNGIDVDDISVTNTDNDVFGIIVEATAGLYTREEGTQTTFVIRLNSQPADVVTIALSSSDLTEGTVSPLSISFNSTNWNTNQTVTATGVNDNVDDGDIAYSVITGPAASGDPLYNNLDAQNVSITNRDNDVAGITVNPESLTLNEEGSAKTFTMALNSEPVANVTIDMNSDDIDKGTVSPASITFTPVDWDINQVITVTPVDNSIDDGNIIFNVVTAPASSLDDNYKNRNAADVTVTSIDNDVAAITVSSISGNTSEDLITATFTIVLNSEPTDDVTIGIISDNTTEGTVLPANITFTPADWNIHQTITVTGIDDAIADGNQTYHIIIGASVSTDFNYDGVDPDDITVVNSDNDSPGVTVFPINNLYTTEAGGTATFTVRLNSQPTDNVVIDISSGDTEEGTVSPAIVLFTTADWNTQQTVTITGVDDSDNDGDIAYSIDLDNPESADTGYDTITYVQDVSVTNRDDIGPRLFDDSATTNEDTNINTDVLTNDFGLDDGSLVITISTQPLHGTAIVEPDKTITYQPNGLFNGTDTYVYKVCDAENDCDEAVVSVNVTPENDVPVALPDTRGTSLNTPVDIDVLFNDYGMEDGGIQITVETSEHGTAIVNPDKTVTFNPTSGYIGLATFIYKLQDIDTDSDTAIVRINVRDVNHVPDAVNDAASTLINTQVDIHVLSNDTGIQDGFGSLSLHSVPLHGTASVTVNRTIIYIPSAGYTGNDLFEYFIEDVDGDFDIATVNITVNPISDSYPVAVNDSQATEFQTAVTIDVLANDTGLGDGVQSITISSFPVNGVVVVNGDFTITYTPNGDFTGIESFSYQISDSDGDNSNIATVTITVLPDGVPNHVPVAVSDTSTTLANTPVDINVLSNDTGLEDGFGDLLIFTEPVHGTAIVNPNRTITYTPSNLFIGDDSFEYWVEDIHGDYDIAGVTVIVSEKPDYKPLANDDSRATEYETSRNIDVLTNDTGLEDVPVVVTVTTIPTWGTANVEIDNTITYIPASGYSGEVTFNYTVTDNDGDYSTATVTITVLPDGVSNHVPVAISDTSTTLANTPVDINVLSNDTGLEDGFGDLLIFTEPVHGTAIVNPNRTITYTPSNLFIGDDSFEYWVADIHGDYDIAGVTVTVSEKPDYKPLAHDDSRATEYETSRNIDVLTNDTGLEDVPVVVTVTTIPTWGTANVEIDNTITYIPASGYSGEVTFNYTVTDNDGDYSTATVTITVLPDGVINYIPVAVADTTTTLANTSVDISVLSNDTGLEDGFGDLLIFTEPVHGTATVNPNRTITYTPSNLFIGDDSFEYWVADIHGDYDIARVTVTVSDKPDYFPDANDDRRGASFNTPVIVDVLINDTGLEDVPVVVSIQTPPNSVYGTAAVNTNDNTITFTPEIGYIGIATFQYKVADKDGDLDIANVSVNVKEGTNYVPDAADDDILTIENITVDINILANDKDLDDGIDKVVIFNLPRYGSVIVNADYSVTYTPSAWFIGTDFFDYMITDIDGDYDIATVTITVNPVVNNIPEAHDDSRGTSINIPVNIDVLINDTGLEDGGLVLSITNNPTNGIFLVNTGNTITYTPNNGFLGIDNFDYQVCDADNDCSSATVTINVKENNSIPIAIDDRFYTNMNTTRILNVLDNDTGLDDGGIVIEILTQVIAGEVTVNDDNTLTYTPLTGFEGTDYFAYKVSDVDGDYDIALVTVEIVQGTLPDVIISSSGNTNEDGTSVSVSFALSVAPVDDVSIDMHSTDETEATLSESRLTFTPENWPETLNIIVTGIDDYVVDGNIDYSIITSNIVTTDNTYSNLSIDNINLMNEDNDTADVKTTLANNITSEDLENTDFSVVLLSEPVEDVIINMSSLNTSEGSLDSSQIIFTSLNWNIPRSVLVKGVDDDLKDGDIEYEIQFTTSSTDQNYSSLIIENLELINIDNEGVSGLIIPEAFSPDGDQYNQKFEILGLEKYDKVSLKIYNRWGNLVYSKDNYQNNWDGKTDSGLAVGNDLPTGTYFYILYIEDINKEISGYVFIKR